MEYTVNRGAQTFGPYTATELRAYVASGNIVLSDIVSGGEFEKKVPVAKALALWDKQHTLLTGLRADIPSPPDLPWWLAAILEIFTGFTFFVAWDVVLGIWLYRVRPQSRALWYFLVAGAIFAINFRALYSDVMHVFMNSPRYAAPYAGVFGITAFVLRIIARFSMRRSLCEHYNEVEPIGLKLSWFWTLIFGGLYFQFHFNRINDAKRTLLNVPA